MSILAQSEVKDNSSELGGSLGLPLIQQSHKYYPVFVNLKTGQVIVGDPNKTRLRRLQKRIKHWSDLMDMKYPKGNHYDYIMVRLSYKGVDDWRPDHIREYMKKVWSLYRNELMGYAWVAELQKRGAIHYHVYLCVTKGTRIPKPDDSEMWPYGYSNIQIGRSPYYLLKYSGKQYQKDFDRFPKGIRAFGLYVKDRAVRLLLRYESLSDIEKGMVDASGWEELEFWRALHKRQEGWFMAKTCGCATSAATEVAEWQKVIDDRKKDV